MQRWRAAKQHSRQYVTLLRIALGSHPLAITLYGIKSCDTMKQARTWLDSHGVQYEFHDYKAVGIDAAVLGRWCAQVGWETLLNRNGTTFRKLPEAQKSVRSEAQAIALMLAQPSLIKRPVLALREKLLVGFKPDSYASAVLERGD
jgi:arsenate reductase